MKKSDIQRIKDNISDILKRNANVAPARTKALLPISALQGKLYEAHVLATICQKLVEKEHLTIKLIGTPELILKQKGGPINKSYPYFEIYRGNLLIGELFTDIYFNTISYELKKKPTIQEYGDYHELDIALVKSQNKGYPLYSEIILAVECKNTAIKKSIIRELLGFRRELAFLSQKTSTSFSVWPTFHTPSEPNSVHMFYCSDPNVKRFESNCLEFGILLEHHIM